MTTHLMHFEISTLYISGKKIKKKRKYIQFMKEVKETYRCLHFGNYTFFHSII